MKGKKQTPSKIKYNAEHPVMSIRLSRELKEWLENRIKGRDISYAHFIMETLDNRKEKDEELWQEGFNEGYDAGLKKNREQIEGIRRELAKVLNGLDEFKVYIKELGTANQNLVIRNRELEARETSRQKAFSDMTLDELSDVEDMILQATKVKLIRLLDSY